MTAETTKQDIVEMLIEAGRVLDEMDVPLHGRYMLVPSWATYRAKKRGGRGVRGRKRAIDCAHQFINLSGWLARM